MEYTKIDDMIDYYEYIFTDYECNHIIKIAKPLLNDSLVAGNTKGYISPGRVSSNCWIPHNETPIIKKICDNITKLLND